MRFIEEEERQEKVEEKNDEIKNGEQVTDLSLLSSLSLLLR